MTLGSRTASLIERSNIHVVSLLGGSFIRNSTTVVVLTCYYFPGAVHIGLAVGIVIALLLIVIITLMVIGFIRKHRRKNSQWGIPNNVTFPNPMYSNNQSKPS